MSSLFYGIKGQKRLCESLEDLVEEKNLSGTVEIFTHKKVKINLHTDFILESVYHSLSEDYGDPDGDIVEPTGSVEELAKKLVEEIKKTFNVWACEPTGESFFYDFDNRRKVGDE